MKWPRLRTLGGLLAIAAVLVNLLAIAAPKASAGTQNATITSGTASNPLTIRVGTVDYSVCPPTNSNNLNGCIPNEAISILGDPSTELMLFPSNWTKTPNAPPAKDLTTAFCGAPNMDKNYNLSIVGYDKSSKQGTIVKLKNPVKGNCFSGQDDLKFTSTSTPTLTGAYINRNTIKLNNQGVYFDSTDNNTYDFYSPEGSDMKGGSNPCAQEVVKDFSSDHKKAVLYAVTSAGTALNIDCKVTKSANVLFTVIANFDASYAWTSPTTIASSDGKGDVVYTADQAGAKALKYIKGSCTITLTVQNGDSSKSTTGKFGTAGSDCPKVDSGTVKIAAYSADASTTNQLNGTDTCTNKDSQGNCINGTDNTLDCGGGALNWILCSVINGASAAADKLDSFIMSTLDIDVKPIFDNTSDPKSPSHGYYTAWNSFRVLATALLVIGGLVMVASQALGFEFLDAYTIRKVLPRLLIAVIGISLSWPLMRLVVSFFDTLGFDIRALMYSPFKDLGGTISAGTGLLTLLGVGAAIMLLGWASLTFIVTALLAVFVGFLIVVIREVAIIMLIILAPIAIACYILPNTQKVWKLWHENFFGLMLMFPIISALIAAGHIFAAVSLSGGGSDTGSVIAQGIAIVAYFVPYFLLPLAARLATGVIGNLAGVVNDRGKGIFDRLKKKRAATAADRFRRAQSQSLYDNSSRMGRFGNKIATWATDPVSNAAYYGRNVPGLKKRGLKVAGQIEHAKVEQTGKLFEEINKMGFNDKGLRALSGMHYGFSDPVRQALQREGLYMKAPQSVGELQRMGQIMSQYGKGTEIIGGNAIANSAGRLATLYQDPEMNKASIAGAGIMGLAAHGFATSRDLSSAANYLAGGQRTTAQRYAREDDGSIKVDAATGKPIMESYETFGAGHETGFASAVIGQAQQLGARSRPEAKNGYGVMMGSDGRFLDGMLSTEEGGGGRMGAVLDTFDSHALASAKGGAIKQVRPEIIRRLQDTSKPGIAKAQEDQLFSWAGPYSQASADVKAEALDIIDKMSGGRKTITATRRDGTTYTYQGYEAGSIGAKFEQYARIDSDPTRRGESGPPPDDDGQQ